jgi:hypothetical protein
MESVEAAPSEEDPSLLSNPAASTPESQHAISNVDIHHRHRTGVWLYMFNVLAVEGWRIKRVFCTWTRAESVECLSTTILYALLVEMLQLKVYDPKTT